MDYEYSRRYYPVSVEFQSPFGHATMSMIIDTLIGVQDLMTRPLNNGGFNYREVTFNVVYGRRLIARCWITANMEATRLGGQKVN